jgi:hypothetical protein
LDDRTSVRPPSTAFAQEFPGRPARSLIAVERDRARRSALALERPLEQSFRRGDIAIGARQEIDGFPVAVDGTIEIGPAALDLHVSFVDPP